MITMALIEDDEVVRKNLAAFFSRQNGIHCAVTAVSVEDFFAQSERVEKLDIVLSDIGLP